MTHRRSLFVALSALLGGAVACRATPEEQATRLRKPPKLVEQGLLSVTPAREPRAARAQGRD